MDGTDPAVLGQTVKDSFEQHKVPLLGDLSAKIHRLFLRQQPEKAMAANTWFKWIWHLSVMEKKTTGNHEFKS